MPYSGRQKTFKLEKEPVTLTRANHAQMIEVASRIREHGEAAAITLLIEASTEPDKLKELLAATDHENVSKLYDAWYEFVGVDPFLKRLQAAENKADQHYFEMLAEQGVVQGTYQNYQKSRLGLISTGSTSETAG